MDASHFDELIRSLTTGPRRGVLGVLAAAPLLGGLLAVLDPAKGEAKGQRKRHKKPHHHSKHTGNRAGKKKKRRCKPNSKATTCAGKCGSVKNNCKKTIDCGSCACDPACAVCQICQEGPNTPGTCVPDPEQNGDACATGDLCITGEVCSAGVCGGGTPVVCLPQDQCHEAGVCDSNTGQCSNPAKPDGAVCDDGDACTQTDTCQSGECTGSNPVVCNDPNDCQNGPGSCDAGSGQCSYPAKADGTRCGNKCQQACAAGACGAGTPVTCNVCQLPNSCNPETGQCAPDPAKQHSCDGPCPSGEWCDTGACASIQTTVTLPECGSRCTNGADLAIAVICGQTVTCPSCELCGSQTGCGFFRFLFDGPEGPDNYCATTSGLGGGGQVCTTNAQCPNGLYCGDESPDRCARICPF